MSKPRTLHKDSLLSLQAKQGTIGRRMKAFNRLEDIDRVLGKILEANSKSGVCPTCGRYLNMKEQELLLKAIRESRKTVETHIRVVKDLYLVYRNQEFQDAVLEALEEADPKLRAKVQALLQDRRATAAEVFGTDSARGISVS